MKGQDRTNAELLEEVAALRQRMTDLEALKTPRMEAEDQLRDNEGKLRAMLQSIGDHMSMMDNDLNIVWANQVAKRIFGEDIIGKKCYEVYHKRDEPCKPSPCIALQAFQDGRIHEHDTQVIDRDGRIIYFHCTANVVLTGDEEKATGVIEISRDITKRKRAEEERGKLIESLQKALANVKTLRGLLPICSSCKKIRDEEGYWHQVEVYIRDHSDADFSHSICEDCEKKLYPQLNVDAP